jgi:type IV pilus assembly protein PilQ
MVPNPEIIIKSNGTSNPTIITPTMPMAPTLPRAVAPPVGDISISNVNSSYDPIDLGPAGNTIIPRLVLRQAPTREVLAVLARYAGVNLIFNDSPSGSGATPTPAAPETATTGQTNISLDLENEPVQQVFNSVLMVSGLKAAKRGKTIFVGADLPPGALNLITRTIRLNQVKSFNAGVFLASQGADFQRLVTKTEDITDPLTGKVIGRREIPSELQSVKAQKSEGEGNAPLILTGLRLAADDRLNSIALIGEPRQVELATSLLTQLDARRRQVAVNLKIVDINLNNIQDYNSSFSFGIGDGYFVQDNGAAVMRFGNTSPLSSTQLRSAIGGVTNPPLIANPLANSSVFLDPNNPITIQGSVIGAIDSVVFPSVAAVSNNPIVTGLTSFTSAQRTVDPTTGVVTVTPATTTYGLPSYFQYPKKFQTQVEAQIRAGNAKILTDPTLVVQEGQQASVKLTQKVVESVDSQVDPLSGVRTTTPVLADAGLSVTVNIDKIDDNGFISLSVSPTIASPGSTQEFSSGAGTTNQLTLLNRREMQSGLIRLRDGQTLILTGVIQETDQSSTSKVPILGDIPFLGALFRSQSDTTTRTEVVIMLTPQVLNDSAEAQFGFNYTPSKASADFLRQQGFPVQAQP